MRGKARARVSRREGTAAARRRTISARARPATCSERVRPSCPASLATARAQRGATHMQALRAGARQRRRWRDRRAGRDVARDLAGARTAAARSAAAPPAERPAGCTPAQKPPARVASAGAREATACDDPRGCRARSAPQRRASRRAPGAQSKHEARAVVTMRSSVGGMRRPGGCSAKTAASDVQLTSTGTLRSAHGRRAPPPPSALSLSLSPSLPPSLPLSSLPLLARKCSCAASSASSSSSRMLPLPWLTAAAIAPAPARSRSRGQQCHGRTRSSAMEGPAKKRDHPAPTRGPASGLHRESRLHPRGARAVLPAPVPWLSAWLAPRRKS